MAPSYSSGLCNNLHPFFPFVKLFISLYFSKFGQVGMKPAHANIFDFLFSNHLFKPSNTGPCDFCS